MKTILIVGGSGLVGTRLTQLLQLEGQSVLWLSRNPASQADIKQYKWDWKNQQLDQAVFEYADTIINLSGASIDGHRWNDDWKKEIYNSRIVATDFLFNSTAKYPNKITTYIAASATGYYGLDTLASVRTEKDPAGDDFLGSTCAAWENSSNQFSSLGIRTTVIRSGIALSPQAVALKKMMLPVQWGLGAVLGTGRQYFPWIHLDDLCGIYKKAVDDNALTGPYNAVAPEEITNQALMEALASTLNRPMWLPHVPGFATRLLFGELAESLLKGPKISAEKIIGTGFIFQYPSLIKALQSILADENSTSKT